MGRGDQYQQRRFTVPVASGDGPTNPWPFTKPRNTCGHDGAARYAFNPTRSRWECPSCAESAAKSR